MIKNILAVLGGIFLVCLFAVLVMWLRYNSMNKVSQEYAMQSAAAMFSTWDYQEMKRRADPIMLNSTSEEDLKKIFEGISHLGKLQSIVGCQGQTKLNFGSGQPPVTAQYDCQLKFDNDTAMITLILIGSYGNDWKIGGMHVTSDYLVKTLK